MSENGSYKEIPISKIKKLKNIRDEAVNLNELMESIKEYGLLQPIVVAEEENGTHLLIAGHRRYLACKKIGMKTIPAVIRCEENREIVQVVENVQRRDMTKVEESAAIWHLRERLGCSASAISEKIGCLGSWVHKRIAFHEVREHLVASGEFTGRGIDALTFDIAWKMHRHNQKHWVKMAKASLGKRWYPEDLQSEFQRIAGGRPAGSRKPGPKPGKNKQTTYAEYAPLPNGEFSIIDEGNAILKLMFMRDGECRQMIKHLEECGGELL